MRIAEAAGRVGVVPHVLRHWEETGVLVPGRDDLGHRVYDDELVTRGRLVRLAQRAGLSLEEIGTLLGATTTERVRLVAAHRDRVRQRISALYQVDGFLAHTLECRHPVVSRCPACSGFAADAVPAAERVGGGA